MENKTINTSGSEDSDDEPLAKIVKRTQGQQSDESRSSSSTSMSNLTTRRENTRPETPKAKPLTAFAHFFNDTQLSIRKKNGTATFEEVSRIVMSMWESLDANTKLIYRKKEEEDKEQLEKSLQDVVPTLLQKISKPDTSTEQTIGQESKEQSSVSRATPTIVSKVVPASSMPTKVFTISASNKMVKANPFTEATITVTGVCIMEEPNTSIVSAQAESTTSDTTNRGNISPDTASKHLPMDADTPTATTTNEPSMPQTTKTLNASSNEASTTVQKISQKSKQTTQTTTAKELKKIEQRLASTSPQPKVCKNSSCGKPSIKHKKWDEDFCSSKCVVEHCREQFTAWVSARN